VVGLRRKLQRTVPLAVTLAVLTMLLGPVAPASAAPGGPPILRAAGHLAVTNLGPGAGPGSRPSPLFPPHHVPEHPA